MWRKLRSFPVLVLAVLFFCILGGSGVEAGVLPSIDEAIALKSWLVIGPFAAGMREDIDHLYEHGGELHIFPQAGMKHTSTMVEGGMVQWQAVQCTEDGKVQIPTAEVNFDLREAYYGSAGYLKNNYGYIEFQNAGKKRGLIHVGGASMFWLNGIPYDGDPDGYGFVDIPVVLNDGLNRLLVKLSGNTIDFHISPVSGVLTLGTRDVTAPEIVYGQAVDSWLGIPVFNTTNEPLDVLVKVGGTELFKETWVRIMQLAPLSVQKVPVQLVSNRVLEEKDFAKGQIEVPVMANCMEGDATGKLTLSGTKLADGFIATFLSATDGSVQEYCVLPPSSYDPAKEYGLILTLHGAGVQTGWVKDAYTPKDWAFTVGPTNRRNYGFDWQDWGRLNALETLAETLKRWKIDEDRIWLTGHSMGGHGTWNIGLQYPDLFAAIAPAAGWTNFESYIPYFMRQDATFAAPELRAIAENIERGNNSLALMENALHLPAYVLHGANDEDVPVDHARRAVQTLSWLGYQAEYAEMADQGHWWNNPETPGADCVNYDPLMQYLQGQSRVELPEKVVYKTVDLGINHQAYWVSIDRQQRVFNESRIEIEITGAHAVTVWADNVEQFTLNLTEGLVALGEMEVTVNGRPVQVVLEQYGPVTLHRGEYGTYITGSLVAESKQKTPEQYGSLKAAYFSPFVLVYSTQGSDAVEELTLSLARLEAQRWWRQGNGYVRIIPDKAVTPEIIQNYNLILFGGPQENGVTKSINQMLPVQLRNGQINVGLRTYGGADLAARFIYPNPLNPDKYVVVNEGNSFEGLRLIAQFNLLRSANQLPDFMLYGQEALTKGWAGMIAAGFFDNKWDLGNNGAYYRDHVLAERLGAPLAESVLIKSFTGETRKVVGHVLNDRLCLPVDEFTEMIGGFYLYDAEKDFLGITGTIIRPKEPGLFWNGGRIYAPVDEMAKAAGVSVKWNREEGVVDVTR